MTLSVGQLHSAKQLLDWITNNQFVKSDIDFFPTILVCPAGDVLNLSTRCGWVEVDLDGKLKLSDKGIRLHNTDDYQLRLREQMLDIISREQPSWCKLFPKGRSETSKFVNADIKQCLDEAGLLANPLSDEVVAWWDDMSSLVRGIKTSVLSQTGRKGERLTLKYEFQRTGIPPVWQSIESNLSGYDVLSSLSDSDSAPLQIEVKATEDSLGYATFHLSSNEWEAAKLARNHLFHLWLIGPSPLLAVISVEEMEVHIPHNSGQGEWESVGISFSVFKERFTKTGKA